MSHFELPSCLPLPVDLSPMCCLAQQACRLLGWVDARQLGWQAQQKAHCVLRAAAVIPLSPSPCSTDLAGFSFSDAHAHTACRSHPLCCASQLTPPCCCCPPGCSTDFEGYSADETVRVVMSGNQEPRGVDITQEAYDQVGAGCWSLAGTECLRCT